MQHDIFEAEWRQRMVEADQDAEEIEHDNAGRVFHV